MSDTAKLQLIQHYNRLGWKVIPLKGKRPFWNGWDDPKKWESGEYSNKKTFEAVKADPTLNLGVLAGEVSGIIALDVDQPYVADYDPEPAIKMGALAHTTSKAHRLIFRSSNPEVLNFNRKVTRKKEELKDAILVGDTDKQVITIVEVLGTGRQFVVPPSIHPETGEPYEWITPLPKGPSGILEIKDLNHLRQVLSKVIKNKEILLDLFGGSEAERKAQEQGREVPNTVLEKWFRTIIKHLEKNVAKDAGNYILLHCPFHPPDEHPSFVIYKNTYLAVDFHDGKVYKLKELAEALGIELPAVRKRKSNVAFIPLDPLGEAKKEEGVKEDGGEKKEPRYGWLRIERVGEKKYLVSVVKDGKTVVPARQVGPDFAFKPALVNYFFGHIKKEVGKETFNQWFGELQERIRKKLAYLVLDIPSDSDEGGGDDPAEHIDLEALREVFGVESAEEARNLFYSIVGDPANPSIDHSAIAEFLMSKFTFKTLIESEDVLYYENGVYRFNGERKIKELVQKLLEALGLSRFARSHLVEEVIEYIKRSTYISIKEFHKFDESGLINLKNGVLDPETLELHPHSPDYLFLWQMPVKYDPLAKCPEIMRFLKQIVEPDDVETLLRVAAYPLMPGQPFQVAIFLVGSGSNGKSTFLNLLKAFYGPENVSALSLHDLENNRFAPASLVGKLANICADIPSKPLDKIETFKTITGGDSIQIERKFRDSYPVPGIRAKLIFSANKLPELSEYNYATLRRVVVVKFPYKFEGAKKDPLILKKLTTEEELSGFLNVVLNAYMRLKREGFATKSVEETQKEWVRWASPLEAFVMEHVEQGEGFVAKDDIWEAFYAYCQKHNIPFPFTGEGAKKVFFRKLKQAFKALGIEATESRPTMEDGKRVRGFTGIRLVNLTELLGEEDSEEDEGEGEEVPWQAMDLVVNTLSMQDATFDELKQMTALPDMVLAKAIKKLEDDGLIFAKDGKYKLINRKKAVEMGFSVVEEFSPGGGEGAGGF